MRAIDIRAMAARIQDRSLGDAIAKWAPRIAAYAKSFSASFPETEPEDVAQDLLLFVIAGLSRFDEKKASLSTFVFRRLHSGWINLVVAQYTGKNGWEKAGVEERRGRTISGQRTYQANVFRRSVSVVQEHAVPENSGMSSWYDAAPDPRTPGEALLDADRINFIYKRASRTGRKLLRFLLSADKEYLERVGEAHARHWRLCGAYSRGEQRRMAGDPRTPRGKPVAFGAGMTFRTQTVQRYLGLDDDVAVKDVFKELHQLCSTYEERQPCL